MLTIGIISLIVGILLIIYSVHSLRNVHKINQNIDKQNQELEIRNQELNRECESLTYILNKTTEDVNKETYELNSLLAQSKIQKEQLSDIQSNISKTLDNQKELSQKAFENYCEVLEKQYDEYEKEYDMYKDALETSYSNRQLELMREIDEVQKDLDSIKATRAAAIQAQAREKEIEKKLSFYCLTIPDTELKDISVLESIAPKLNKPRVLYMLIWQTFFRTPMTNLCNQIIGTTIKSGIYKITNIKTKECYIDQAVDLASRWKDHAKFGLRIDTPAGNKLYKAMQEYGIWNFSWEVLEEVPPAQLSEKEDYYIQLYDSINFGYNSIKAPTKKGI